MEDLNTIEQDVFMWLKEIYLVINVILALIIRYKIKN
jgi:hypothetical protein